MHTKIIAAAVMAFGAACVHAQTFPDHPLRIMVGPPGSGNDLVSRILAQGMTQSLGQQVIVDNRADIVATETAAAAPPDGYTMLFGAGSIWIGPLIQKMSYSAGDFAPITWAMSSPLVLVVNPQLPANSVKELIELAKARPGQINYASSGTGGNPHLSAELFNLMAGVQLTRVNYKGGTPGITSVVAGETQVMFITTTGIMPHMKAGRLRALAICNAKPSALLPGIPPIGDTVPGYVSLQLSGALAPAKTPADRIALLNREMVRILKLPDIQAKLAAQGQEIQASTPQEFAAAIKNDMDTNARVIKAANIRAD
jgi:tripartite-type tricarboxylate transporter receptor subunit TctC